MRSTRTIKMKKMSVISVIVNRSFAFVKGNRPTNSKAVTAKMKSIEEYGLLSPITVVDGEQVITSGGHLVDLNGKDIPDSQSVNYYAVLDGQHRLIAYIKLGLNLNDLVFAEPLNVDMSIAALIAEMNICTTTWKGTDYMAAPAMTLSKTNDVFEFAVQLRSKGFPLATISQWCTGTNSLKPKDLVNCVKSGELPKILQSETWYQRSIRWYEAAQEKFSDSFLSKKYLIAYIVMQYNNAADPVAYCRQIEQALKKLTPAQAAEIMEARKIGLKSREQMVVELLEQYLG